MELFLFHFRQTGSTLEQRFLGVTAYGTIEPANLEAILSTRAKGRPVRQLITVWRLLDDDVPDRLWNRPAPRHCVANVR